MGADSGYGLRLLAPAGLAMVVAACGSHGTDRSAPISATSPPSAAATAQSSSPATTLPPPVPADTVAAPQRCHTTDVAVEFLPAQGATGHSVRSVALRNAGGGTCTVYGYVGMQLLDGAGHFLPTVVQRGGGMLGTPAPAVVSLAPMAIAYFEVEYSSVQSGPSACPTSAQVEVTPPDETTYVIVRAQLAPCADGRLSITALHAGPPRA
ncbi:MAG: DUF4232 domain-containing protein [Candidatus Dormibacteria bacterium]